MPDVQILQMALLGYRAQRAAIDRHIAALEQQLLGKAAPAAAGRSRRKLSQAARQRIIAAQKKRWAEFRARRAAAAEPGGSQGAAGKTAQPAKGGNGKQLPAKTRTRKTGIKTN